jgi:cation diffusion facilitator CzcD-associated flavoprotein CzcO
MSAPEHFDVLIVGAGISGIGAAYHLQQQCPGKRFVILESQAGYGGTWRTHRYPGIRSDSDLFTFGYRFKPWHGAPIATGAEILKYLGEVIDENRLAPHIRYGQAIGSARWSSADARWLVQARVAGRDDAAPRTQSLSANFLFMCQGYYRHSEGYAPQWPGMAQFKGRVVHPQTWPDELELADKRVVVIGSGATAATLIPAIAGRCAHVTMLQRSPTYFITGRNANDLADMLRQLDIPPEWTHEIVRRKVLLDQANFTRRCLAQPEVVKKELLAGVGAALGPGHEDVIEKHLTPRYRPWQQRIAFVPDADLFKCLREGRASIVTDEIDTFTESGIRLKSGRPLDADIVVTATGFNLNVMGDIAFFIDDRPLDWADTVAWRGAMFSGVPNLAWVFGYFRASWTLRADLLGDFVCRLLQHRDARGAEVVTPMLRAEDRDMALQPWVDPKNFNPGYLARGMHLLPRQGDRSPWLHAQDYWIEKDELPKVDLDDETLVYRAKTPA